MGAGRGPGVGRGSGGGTGGGAYRPGGAVTAPRLIVEVRPTYTSDALLRRIQGTVELEIVPGADHFFDGAPAAEIEAIFTRALTFLLDLDERHA